MGSGKSRIIPCLRCGESFEQFLRSPGKYCTECRALNRLEYLRERNATLEADKQVIRGVAESMREYLMPEMYAKVEDYLTSIGIRSGDAQPIVSDRMPDGSNSPGGSEDGVSTYYEDLAEELEAKRMRVIMHDWFKENPHWTEGMHGA